MRYASAKHLDAAKCGSTHTNRLAARKSHMQSKEYTHLDHDAHAQVVAAGAAAIELRCRSGGADDLLRDYLMGTALKASVSIAVSWSSERKAEFDGAMTTSAEGSDAKKAARRCSITQGAPPSAIPSNLLRYRAPNMPTELPPAARSTKRRWLSEPSIAVHCARLSLPTLHACVLGTAMLSR